MIVEDLEEILHELFTYCSFVSFKESQCKHVDTIEEKETLYDFILTQALPSSEQKLLDEIIINLQLCANILFMGHHITLNGDVIYSPDEFVLEARYKECGGKKRDNKVAERALYALSIYWAQYVTQFHSLYKKSRHLLISEKLYSKYEKRISSFQETGANQNRKKGLLALDAVSKFIQDKKYDLSKPTSEIERTLRKEAEKIARLINSSNSVREELSKERFGYLIKVVHQNSSSASQFDKVLGATALRKHINEAKKMLNK